jgi:hypothetical protein
MNKDAIKQGKELTHMNKHINKERKQIKYFVTKNLHLW